MVNQVDKIVLTVSKFAWGLTLPFFYNNLKKCLFDIQSLVFSHFKVFINLLRNLSIPNFFLPFLRDMPCFWVHYGKFHESDVHAIFQYQYTHKPLGKCYTKKLQIMCTVRHPWLSVDRYSQSIPLINILITISLTSLAILFDARLTLNIIIQSIVNS